MPKIRRETVTAITVHCQCYRRRRRRRKLDLSKQEEQTFTAADVTIKEDEVHQEQRKEAPGSLELDDLDDVLDSCGEDFLKPTRSNKVKRRLGASYDELLGVLTSSDINDSSNVSTMERQGSRRRRRRKSKKKEGADGAQTS